MDYFVCQTPKLQMTQYVHDFACCCSCVLKSRVKYHFMQYFQHYIIKWVLAVLPPTDGAVCVNV